MSMTYAEQQIRAALKQSRGNTAKAQKLLIAKCAQDHKLLLALTKPHLSGIASHAISRIATKPLVNKDNPPPEEPEVDQEDKFGREMLKSFSMGKPVKFSEESFGAPLKKMNASQQHIDAINKFAKRINPSS